MSNDCEHNQVNFERDTLNSGWIRAICGECGKEGKWRLSKTSAITTLVVDDGD
jgi:hypothetical protein